jgi:adenosylmethionine-8-amino-7-oxononanoate aminotransferase
MPLADPAQPVGSEPHGGGMQTFAARPGTPRHPRIARAEGVYLWDTNGRRLLDVASGPVAVNLGHAHPRILAAMAAQAAKVTFTHYGQFESEANLAMAERLTAAAGPGYERAWFCSGGSEAVEASLKFARQLAVVRGQPERWKVISRASSYHGNTLGALAVTGDANAHRVFGPMLAPMPKIPTPFSFRVPANHTAATWAAHCADELQRTIEREGPRSVLAFIMEPVGGVSTGALVVPDSYLRRVREICSAHGVLLIYDEVITGAGRTGPFLAAHRLPDARPDLVVMAKGLTGGYTPFGALLASAGMVAEIASAGGFMHGHTYTGNPMSCAIADAAVAEVIERDLGGNAARLGPLLTAKLQALADRTPLIGDVRGRGLLQAIELVADKATKRALPLDRMAPQRLQRLALDAGLSLYGRRTNAGRDGEWLMIAPPLIATEAHLDEIVAGLDITLARYADELTQDGVRLGS